MSRSDYDSGKRTIGKNYAQPIYQEPADGYEHCPAAEVDWVIGGGTYRIGERNHWPTEVESSAPRESGALRAFWK